MDSSNLDPIYYILPWVHKSEPPKQTRSVQPFCIHHSKGSQCFSVGQATPKLAPLPIKRSGPPMPHLIMVSQAHLSQPLNKHLNWFSHFCRNHKYHQLDRHTQTDHSMCSNQPLSVGWEINVSFQHKNVISCLLEGRDCHIVRQNKRLTKSITKCCIVSSVYVKH